jgi:predicted dehydrogenase
VPIIPVTHGHPLRSDVIDHHLRGTRREKHRGGVALGLIGAGAMWERRYRPVLSRLADRLTIRAVYDSVPARAQLAAAELKAAVVDGLHRLYERHDLQGVLILDPDWQGLVPARLACLCHKPAFLAGSLGEDLSVLRELHSQSQQTGLFLMTEFSRRHTPTTNRLRELMATKLGATRRVQMQASLPPGARGETLHWVTEYLVGLLDWCAYVTGRIPVKLQAFPLESAVAGQGGWRVEIGFRPDAQGTPSATAELLLNVSPTAEANGVVAPEPLCLVECERGSARFANSTEIAWENDTGAVQESLTSDRSEAEVMLDKFCRRVLGGLVPAADVLDACRAIALARAAERSLEIGTAVIGPWDGI